MSKFGFQSCSQNLEWPCKLSTTYNPIDTSLNFTQDKKVIRVKKLAKLAIQQGARDAESYLIVFIIYV